MYGWMGKILKIDLSTEKKEEIKLSDSELHQYLGGRGLGVKLYTDLCSPQTDPLSPENALIFMTGPLTGTTFTSGRYQVVSRSPLTNTISDSSSGGNFGVQLKRTGYDGLIITGKAVKPVIMILNEQVLEFRTADKIWGKNTVDTINTLNSSYPAETSIACIGPAGENQVLFASIINDNSRAAGRGGLGAVMGAKNLKAIVVSGNQQVQLAEPDNLKALQVFLDRLIDKNPITGKALQILGTPVLMNIINDHGMLGTYNFQSGVFNNASGLSGEKMGETILRGRSACFRCPIACGRKTEVNGKTGEGPEFETLWALGANLGITDLKKVTAANYLCNEMGLDTISTGNTIGCAMEMSEKGFLDHKITWGDADHLAEMIVEIAQKKGFGKELALGSKRLAEKYGCPELAMQVKGLEMPAYDPRGAQGQALAYATANRGACHVEAYLIGTEILGQPVFTDRFSVNGKAELVAFHQDFSALVDCLVLCRFLQFCFSVTTFNRIFKAVTGVTMSDNEFLSVGRRTFNLERKFNVAAGFSRKDDILPPRFANEVLKEGNSRNRTVDLTGMLDSYYQIRGWDQQGIPLMETLKTLKI